MFITYYQIKEKAPISPASEIGASAKNITTIQSTLSISFKFII